MSRYETYKDSGIEWIGEIPAHWDVVRLKYVANSNPSNVDKKSKEDEAEVFLCNYVDVYKNEFISSEIEFMKATASPGQIEKFQLQKGDVIATKDSESPDDIAIPALVVEDLENVVCGYHLNLIRPISIYGPYLFRLFQSPCFKAYFEIAANGITRYGIGAEKFSCVEVLLPSNEEQITIAAYLEQKTAEIDDLIADKKRQLELYAEEKIAIINQAVTKGIDPNARMKDSGIEWLGDIPEHWHVKRLKYVAKMQSGYAFSSNDFTSQGVQLIKIANLYNNEFHLDRQPTFLPESFLDTHSDWRVSNGDILMSMTGTLGKRDYGFAILIEETEGSFLLNQRVSKIHNVISVETSFLIHCLRSEYFLNNLFSIPAGTKQGNFSNENVLDQAIVFPPDLKEQQDLISHIDKANTRIDAQVARTNLLIDFLLEYRTALVSEVVTGKMKID